MLRKFLRSKIHRATVTQADLHYEGSLTLPPDLLLAAGISPFESVHVWNVTRGTRLETETIASHTLGVKSRVRGDGVLPTQLLTAADQSVLLKGKFLSCWNVC